MSRFPLAVVAITMVVMGCTHHTSTAPIGPTSVGLKPGENGQINGAVVQLVRVDSDSRCPLGVLCVSAGNAVVAITVHLPSDPIGSGTAAIQFLNTSVEPRSLVRSGYRVTLDSLTPYPAQPGVIPQDQYTAYFTVVSLPD